MKPNQKDNLDQDKLNSLSDFLVISPLGRGAGSLVYKIKSRKSSNEYALKSIHKEKTSPSYKAILQRLQNEIEIHSLFHHENIVQLINHFDDSDNNYILLEYCEGGDLFGYVQNKKKINEQELKRLGLQFAQGLKHIHDNKVIHRDLKLGNILLTKDHNLKICDFGLSIKINTNDEITTLCGTPNYISPFDFHFNLIFQREMIKHQPYNQKIDIWAFGCILHHMATGFNPFEGLNPQQVLAKISNQNFEIKTNISDSLDDLLSHMFQENPDKRFSVGDVISHPFFTGSIMKQIQQQASVPLLHKRHQSQQTIAFKKAKNQITLQSILVNNKENFKNLLKYSTIQTARNFAPKVETKKALHNSKSQYLTQRNLKQRNSVVLNTYQTRNQPDVQVQQQFTTQDLLKRSQSIENLFTRRNSKNLTQQGNTILQRKQLFTGPNILQEQKNLQQQKNIQSIPKTSKEDNELFGSPQKVKEKQQSQSETDSQSQNTIFNF